MAFKGGRYYLVTEVDFKLIPWSHSRGYFIALYDTSWATETALRDYVNKYAISPRNVFIRTPKGKLKKI